MHKSTVHCEMADWNADTLTNIKNSLMRAPNRQTMKHSNPSTFRRSGNILM